MNRIQWYAGQNMVARALFVVSIIALLSFAAGAYGQNIVRVEEDWELQIGEPDSNSTGPQVVATMCPNADLSGTHFTMEINHRSAPTWSPGGISIHRWEGAARYASFDRADRTTMQTSNEVVTWTQTLYHNSGRLNFEVFNGISSTWGPFGYSGMMRLDTNWGQDNINGYTPAVSVAQSGAAYAGNRVQLLKIKAIRVTLSDSSVITDNTERIVHQLIE